MKAEFDIVHDGVVYCVEVSFETHRVDDSFDGHRAGYTYTFESSHRELDIDTLQVNSCTDTQDLEVDVESVLGLGRAIEDKALELEF